MTEARIGMAPGIAFGRARERMVRLCYAKAPELLHTAMDRLAAFVAGYPGVTPPHFAGNPLSRSHVPPPMPAIHGERMIRHTDNDRTCTCPDARRPARRSPRATPRAPPEPHPSPTVAR